MIFLFSLVLSAGFGQASYDVPTEKQAWQAEDDKIERRYESKLQGEVSLRFRNYREKDFNALTPLLDLEYEHSKTKGEVKTFYVLGGRYFKIDDHEFEPTTYAGIQKGNFSLKAGWQTISWGQSFAVFSADLVNPKDLRDPLNTDPTWINIPVFMLNTEYFFEGGGIQFFLTPAPRNNKYSLPGNESDFLASQGSTLQFTRPDEFSKDLNSRDAEFGGRINYIFGGVELSFFALRHWNRNGIFLTQIENGVPKLKPLRFQLDSYALGFNYDLNNWVEGLVARGDYVAHQYDQKPNKTGTALETASSYDLVTGLDWTSETGWALGAQVINHVNQYHDEGVGTVRATKKLFEDKLELSLMAFTGLNSKESWYQPRITWLPKSAIEISAMADIIDADSADVWSTLAPFKKEDRTQVQLKYLF